MNAQSPIVAKGAPATARGLKINPIVGSLPVLQYCAPEQLLIDESYQRSLEVETSVTLIRRIAANWDWGLCQPLFVARRSDGGLYVVDGQHRLAAAVMRADIPQLPCVVTHFDSPEQEAGAFVALNQQRRPLNQLDLFRASLASGDPAATKIKECLEAAGLRLAKTTNNQAMKAGDIGNVGGLLRALSSYGEQVLLVSLQVLARAYPQQILRYAGTIFPGIVAVVAGELHNRTTPTDLVDRLGGFVARDPQHEWYRRFAQAVVDDLTLRRRDVAEKVLRASWVEYSQAQLGRDKPWALDERPPATTSLKPAEMAWCNQCDSRRSGAQAAACQSPFCSLKEIVA